MLDAVRHSTFPARLDCHFLLREPVAVASDSPLVLALHGFGQNPEAMLKATARIFGPGAVLASLQGPNQFFLDPAAEAVGYCWITNRHAASSIRLHHDMVAYVLDAVGSEFRIPPARRILVGFSQSVALNYRFAATFPDAAGGVAGICGGLPSDWETGGYQPVRAAVLHIARRGDPVYPPSVTEQYAARLRIRTRDVEFCLLDGGHQMPSGAGPLIEAWLKRVLR